MQANTHAPTVLLVDDNPVDHKLFDAFLGVALGRSYHFMAADTLAKALQMIETFRFDAIFVDNRLERGSTYLDNVPPINATGHAARLFVISAEIDEPVFRRHRDLGVERVIDKAHLMATLQGGLLAA